MDPSRCADSSTTQSSHGLSDVTDSHSSDNVDGADDIYSPTTGKMREYWRSETMLDAGKGTLISSTLTLGNTCIGAGILSLPYALKETGIVLGVVSLVVIAVLVLYTQRFVVFGCLEHQPRSYEELVRSLFGKRWGTFMEVLIFVYQLGACVGYLLVIVKQAHPLIGNGVSEPVLCVCASVLVLPFCLLRELSALRYTSFMGVLAPCFMSLVLTFKGIQHFMNASSFTEAFSNVVLVNESNPIGFAVAVPILCFALNSHVMVPSVYADMEPAIKSPKSFNRVTLFAYTIVLFVYVPAAFFGYLVCGGKTPDDILAEIAGDEQCFSPNDKLIQACRFMISIAGICCYPLNHFPGRSALFNILFKEGSPAPTRWMFNFEAVCFVSFTCLIAILVPTIHVVFDLLGATCAATLMFLFPAVIFWKYSARKVQRDENGLTDHLLSNNGNSASPSHEEKVNDIENQVYGMLTHIRKWWHTPIPCMSAFYLIVGTIILCTGTTVTTMHIFHQKK
eukprot:g4913.t1